MDKPTSPVGKTVRQGTAKRARSAAYRNARAQTAESAAIAKQVIHLRTRLGITQQELAKRVGTSYSQISRIESGRHEVSHTTFRRVYRALGATPLVGYELPARPGQPVRRELIAI